MNSPQPTANAPLGPIPDHLIHPSYPDNQEKQAVEGARQVRANFDFLQTTTNNPSAPYVWGFTIYRAVFGPGSNERFTAGLSRLEDWIRWSVRQSRYEEDWILWNRCPATVPPTGAWDPTDAMAQRMWNEVVEDYPDRDKVRSGEGTEAGDDDFEPIGRAFIAWVESTGVDPLHLLVRYDHCLIIEELSLQAIERLPAEVPEVKPRPFENPTTREEQQELTKLLDSIWVWMLDRETMARHLEGDTRPRLPPESVCGYRISYIPPWLRLRLSDVYSLWFRRSRNMETPSWDSKCEQDAVQYDKVFWWNPLASVIKEARARGRHDSEPNFTRQWIAGQNKDRSLSPR
jgi:hypothetical protein